MAVFSPSHILPFFYELNVLLFIGIEISIIVLARFLFKNNLANEKYYQSFMKFLRVFFNIKFILLIFIAISGAVIAYSDSFKISDPMINALVKTLWTLFGFIIINIVYMVLKLKNARKAYIKSNFIEVQEKLILICFYFTPLNLVISFMCVYLGIVFRNFS